MLCLYCVTNILDCALSWTRLPHLYISQAIKLPNGHTSQQDIFPKPQNLKRTLVEYFEGYGKVWRTSACVTHVNFSGFGLYHHSHVPPGCSPWFQDFFTALLYSGRCWMLRPHKFGFTKSPKPCPEFYKATQSTSFSRLLPQLALSTLELLKMYGEPLIALLTSFSTQSSSYPYTVPLLHKSLMYP